MALAGREEAVSERDPLNQELDDLRSRCAELEAVVVELHEALAA